MYETVHISTHTRTEFVDITSHVQQIVKNSGVQHGVCFIYVPHTTAAVTINEHADPSVPKDILMELNKIVPFHDNYAHDEGNSAAHIKASVLGNSVTVFIEEHALVLGTWQGIYFCEFDGARHRKVYVKLIGG